MGNSTIPEHDVEAPNPSSEITRAFVMEHTLDGSVPLKQLIDNASVCRLRASNSPGGSCPVSWLLVISNVSTSEYLKKSGSREPVKAFPCRKIALILFRFAPMA
jgi:hypothetical protein